MTYWIRPLLTAALEHEECTSHVLTATLEHEE